MPKSLSKLGCSQFQPKSNFLSSQQSCLIYKRPVSLVLVVIVVSNCHLYKLCRKSFSKFVGNKAKVRISKRMSQENSTPNFPKNEHDLPRDGHTYVCVSGGKKYSIFGKFGLLCFFETPILRSALLPYYQRKSQFFQICTP